jgi:hypothetical protein
MFFFAVESAGVRLRERVRLHLRRAGPGEDKNQGARSTALMFTILKGWSHEENTTDT